jgi:hypothetical protein
MDNITFDNNGNAFEFLSSSYHSEMTETNHAQPFFYLKMTYEDDDEVQIEISDSSFTDNTADATTLFIVDQETDDTDQEMYKMQLSNIVFESNNGLASAILTTNNDFNVMILFSECTFTSNYAYCKFKLINNFQMV